MIREDDEKGRMFQNGLRSVIKNKAVPLAIRDDFEIVTRR